MIAAATVLMVLIYLLASKLTYGIGFPLDDSWIHQTYARNLADHGEWAFRPGTTSAGSTSPLWSALLSIGFFLGLAPYIWTFFLGAVIIFSLAGCNSKEPSDCGWTVQDSCMLYSGKTDAIGGLEPTICRARKAPPLSLPRHGDLGC